jgi:hypothetical protein
MTHAMSFDGDVTRRKLRRSDAGLAVLIGQWSDFGPATSTEFSIVTRPARHDTRRPGHHARCQLNPLRAL